MRALARCTRAEQACVAAIFAGAKVYGRHGARGEISGPRPEMGMEQKSGLGMGPGLRLRPGPVE